MWNMGICFPDSTSDFQTSVTFLIVDKTQSVGIHFLNLIVRNILVIKLSGLGNLLRFSFSYLRLLCFQFWKAVKLRSFVINMTSYAIIVVIMCDHV